MIGFPRFSVYGFLSLASGLSFCRIFVYGLSCQKPGKGIQDGFNWGRRGLGEEVLVARRRCFVYLAFERRYASTFSQIAFFFSWFDMFCGGAYGLCILEILTCLTLIVHCRSEVRERSVPCKKTSISRYTYVVLFGWLISSMH